MSQLGNKFTREDREHRSYREKPAGSNEVVQGVELIQEAGETVKVKALNVLVGQGVVQPAQVFFAHFGFKTRRT